MNHHTITISSKRWSDLVKNEDCRFFLHTKNVLQKLTKHPSVHLKMSDWNCRDLRRGYEMSLKIKHHNLIKPICYFEFEADIINYLYENTSQDDIYEENAVILLPNYRKCTIPDLNNMDNMKQLILFLYTALFTYNISLDSVDINDIYIEDLKRSKTLEYLINGKHYYIKTKTIVKMDVLHYATNTDTLRNAQYNGLYKNISSILEQTTLHANVLDLVKSFIQENGHTIHPSRILDTILSSLYTL